MKMQNGKPLISINHSLVYYPDEGSRRSVLRVSKPKTEAGIRMIPVLDIFTNRNGSAPNPQAINRAIKRIISSYNAEEIINAKRERRTPIILPNFSCHHLRHTFCTRLCENESNLKVIQSIMGHRSIETTMDIYAEATEQKKQQSFENLSKLNIF